jgi:hypothetical protein
MKVILHECLVIRLATGRWFSPGTPVSSTNKTVSHNITDILLKVALSTIKPNQSINLAKWFSRRFSYIHGKFLFPMG